MWLREIEIVARNEIAFTDVSLLAKDGGQSIIIWWRSVLYWFEQRDRESATRVARRSGLLVYNGTGTVDPRLQWNDLTLTPQIEVSLLGQNHSARHNLARFPNSPSSD